MKSLVFACLAVSSSQPTQGEAALCRDQKSMKSSCWWIASVFEQIVPAPFDDEDFPFEEGVHPLKFGVTLYLLRLPTAETDAD